MGRECNKCVHRKEHGCEKWDCEFEPYAPTREEALAILNTYDMSDDNEDMEFKSVLALAIKALKKEPCEDAVSRKAIEKLKRWRFSYDNNTTIPKSDLFVKLTDIRDLPPVTPTRKKGKWIKEISLLGWDGCSYQCSECGRSIHLVSQAEVLKILDDLVESEKKE